MMGRLNEESRGRVEETGGGGSGMVRRGVIGWMVASRTEGGIERKVVGG